MRLHSEALITEFTDQGHWGDQTVLGILDATVARLGDAIALEDPPDREELVGSAGRTLTWREFGTAVDGIAAGLHARGVGKDDVVVVQLPNVWELPALYFAIARTGAVIAPMPVQWRERELRHIVGLTEAVMYIGVDELKGAALMPYADAELPGTVQRLELCDVAALAATPAPPTTAYPTVDANDVFTLCWTSGTEAQPKGCPLSHNNWIFQGQSFRRATNLRDNCRILGPAPIVNMTGVGIMIMWLLSGGRLMLHQPLNLPALLRQIPDAEFTMLVPAILTMLLKLPEAQQPDFSTVEAIATGSAPPSPWAIEEFRRRWGVEVVNVFGQNEGTILAAGSADVPDSVMRSSHFPWWGKPAAAWASGVDGIDVKLLADDGGVCTEVGDIGELAYRGPNVFPGYFKADELNLEAFTAEGHVRTGDLFKILDDRHIGFVDRKKDIIIRGGFNVSAAEVETVALGHPGIADAAAVAAPDEVLGERVCLFVVPQDSSAPPSLEDIVTFMRGEGIAIYKLPERLEIVAEIPRNPVGKILKKDLRTRLRTVTPA